MACARGAASPDTNTQRRLFAASGGYCQNPNCVRELFIDADGQAVNVAEMAHVFAANDDGPRAKPELTKEERGAFENLILLCAICHTMIDKAPDAFPDTRILEWKREHAKKLAAVFGITKLPDRAAAREAIAPLLATNHAIFSQYGPHIEAARDPESGAAETWRRKMLTGILPNNNRVLAQLDANRHLLSGEELKTVEAFRQHVDDLEAVHIGGANEDASRFPVGMQTILEK